MIYYKVKPEHDQKRLYKVRRGGGLEIDGFLIGNELFTPSEIKKYPGAIAYCDKIEIPKSKIYFFFGVRFEA